MKNHTKTKCLNVAAPSGVRALFEGGLMRLRGGGRTMVDQPPAGTDRSHAGPDREDSCGQLERLRCEVADDTAGKRQTDTVATSSCVWGWHALVKPVCTQPWAIVRPRHFGGAECDGG